MEGGLTPSVRMLADMLESRTGQLLSENRMWRIETSLKPILRANGLATFDDLVAAIAPNPEGALATETVNALINNETSFFRDPQVFQMLKQNLLPEVIRRAEEVRRRSKVLRVWCAGCSTGQEAYSVAMTFHAQKAAWSDWRLQILATDISSTAIDRARSGLFSQMEVQRGLAINDLLQWMEPSGDQWQIASVLRDMIDFRVDNLFSPRAPIGEYDLILCRNVFLYFSTERKQEIFSVLARHSMPDGFLLLGAGETVIGQTGSFVVSPRFRGAYERGGAPAPFN